jgi:hypothetical protein
LSFAETAGKGAGARHGRFIGEGQAEAFPVEIVEGVNELGERLTDV